MGEKYELKYITNIIKIVLIVIWKVDQNNGDRKIGRKKKERTEDLNDLVEAEHGGAQLSCRPLRG